MGKVNATSQAAALNFSPVRILSCEQPKAAGVPDENIAALSQAIVRGNEAAFEQFYDLYSNRLYRFLLVLTRGSEEAAREVHQMVLIKAARKFRVFANEGELWAWLSQVTRHAYVDFVRKQARNSGHTDFGSELPEESDPGTAVDGKLLRWLDDGLEALALEERALIESIYFCELRQKEVAQARGSTVKAVEAKLGRVREKLRQFILERMRHERE
jgi:RNA polymerase sigma-70 factor (ECF subfamily)